MTQKCSLVLLLKDMIVHSMVVMQMTERMCEFGNKKESGIHVVKSKTKFKFQIKFKNDGGSWWHVDELWLMKFYFVLMCFNLICLQIIFSFDFI